MPKKVFIKSRNKTLVFPDEATQDQINESVNAMFPPTGKDMADYVEGLKNATIEGESFINPFDRTQKGSLSLDNYVLYKQDQADKKTSMGEAFGIAKDTFNTVRDELATGIGTGIYKTYQGEGADVAESVGQGMQAGLLGTYDILNKIFDPAQPIPRKEDFVGKRTTRLVDNPNFPNAYPMEVEDVNTEEDYNNFVAAQMQRDADAVNRLYTMESIMRNASIPEVARGAQFVDPALVAGLGGALVKVALKGGKTLITKAAATTAARAAGTEGVETAAEAAARTAAQGVDNIPPTVPDAINTIESGGTVPFTPDPFPSTAPNPMAQAGLRAAENTAGAVQFTAGLPSQALKKIGELAESVAPGTGVGAQATALTGSLMVGGGTPAAMLAGAKTTEKIAEFFRSFARVSREEASRAGRLERIALDPLTSGPTRKAAATLAQFQPAARTIIDLSKGALKGGVAGSVVGGVLGGLAERNLEGAAAGMGAGLALGGFYGSLNAGFDIGKEAFGGSTQRTRTNATGDINRFIASRPELEQAGWIDAMRTLVEKIGPERAASQMDALRVAEASGVKLRIATPDENKLWKAPGWLNPDQGELVLNPPRLQADTPAHEATHAIFASNVKRQYRSQIEEAIYGIPDPVTGEIVKAGFLDDAALAKVAEQIRDSYKKGDQTTAADRFQGLANNLKNSTDKESLMKARSAIADEMAADYGGKFFDRVRAGRFNPDRLPLVYRNALNAIDDGIFNTFKSVVYERGMDLGFDAPSRSFRNAKGKPIRSPKLDEIFKRAYSQKSSAETVVSKKPDLIPVKPSDRAIWAKTHGGARGILNEDDTPKTAAQIKAEATARWENMRNRLAPLPEGDRVGLNFSRDKSGKTTMTAQGQLSPAALTAILESDMLDASANAVLRDVIISMQDPNKSTFDTRYYKVYERGKGNGKMVAGVYPPSQNEILPYKVTMNSADGVNIHAVDITKVRQRLATAMNKPQFKELYNNPTDALKDFKKYLDNMTQVGKPALASAELLGENGAAKRNLFHNALGFALRKGEDFSNIPDSVIKNANTVKTYRVERFTKLIDTGFKFPFEEGTTYYRGMKNFQPSAFTPETLPNGESFTNPDGYRILNKAGSKLFRTYDDTGKLIGVAESKEKAMKKAQDKFAKKAMKEEPANIRFQFAGEAAEMPKFMRDSLESAKAMAKEGKDSKTIRAITGWFPGKYDDKMRWEVPDNGAKWSDIADQLALKSTPQSLGRLLDHDNLFTAYPQARDVKVAFTRSTGAIVDEPAKGGGSFNPETNTITVNLPASRSVLLPDTALSTILHEVQHWIQDKEGFAKGSSPEQSVDMSNQISLLESKANAMSDVLRLPAVLSILDAAEKNNTSRLMELRKSNRESYNAVNALFKELGGSKSFDEISSQITALRDKADSLSPIEQYRRTAGEIESRDIQARQSFTPEQRKAIAPYSSENIAKEEAIVLKSASKSPTEMRFQADAQSTTAVPDFSKTPAGDKPLLEVIYFKNQDKFKKAVAQGRVQKGVPIETFENMALAIHQPDSAMVGDVVMQGKTIVNAQGGAYYPVLFGEGGSFWASTEKAANAMAAELNKISRLNNGKALMGLTSAPIDKLFSSTTMANGTMKLLYEVSQSPRQYGINKSAANKMLVNAVNTPLVITDTKTGKVTTFKFNQRLRSSSSIEDNMALIKVMLDPDKSVFPLRKHFVENIARSIADHLSKNKRASQDFADLISPSSNKYPTKFMAKKKLAKSGIIQALGDLFSEDFIKDFQSVTNPGGVGGYLYAIIEMDGEVVAVKNKQHASYDYSIDSTSGKQPKVHILDKPVKWNDTLGLVKTQDYVPESIKDNIYPTSVGFSFSEEYGNLMVMKPKEGALASIEITRFQPDPASPNILNGSDGSRIIKSTSGKYRVYLATGALAGVKDTLESAQKLVQSKSKSYATN